VTPLIWLTKKDQPFSWGVEANNVFQFLKAYFMIDPFFIHVDLPNLLFWTWMFLILQ
jgi:hypothetical protein